MTDLPGPLTTRPEIGAYYHGITFMHPDMVALLVWEDDVHDHRTFDRQLAFPETDAGRLAAAAKAHRMLAVDDLAACANRLLEAIRGLSENPPEFPKLTYFEAPLAECDGVYRWRELNDAGKALGAALTALGGGK